MTYLEEFLPQAPIGGPPLPKALNVKWPGSTAGSLGFASAQPPINLKVRSRQRVADYLTPTLAKVPGQMTPSLGTATRNAGARQERVAYPVYVPWIAPVGSGYHVFY